MLQINTNVRSQKRNYGLDLIKAVSILAVVLLHVNPFDFSLSPTASSESIFLKLPEIFVKILQNQLLHLAVPAFFLVSLYLFFIKQSNNPSYFKHRISRVFKIYVFWTFVQFLVYYALSVCSYAAKLHLKFPKTSIIETIYLGGPSIPLVQGSVFYFLFDLMVLIFMASLYYKFSSRIKIIVGLIVIVSSLIYFEVASIYSYKLMFWRLDNFIVYIPTTYYLVKYPQIFNKFRYYLLAGFILFCVPDIMLEVSGYAVNEYGRVSMFLGTVTLFCFIQFHDFKEKNIAVQFLSKYSLGIFALHKYWQVVFQLVDYKIFSVLGLPTFIAISDLKLSVVSAVITVTVLAFSLLSVYLLSLTRLKEFV